MSLLERFARGILPAPEPPAGPDDDLVAESWLRSALAIGRARDELGRGVPVTAPELPATHWLPDPYGPDPYVFGWIPRVRGD